MRNEIWKPVKGFESLYEISNYFRVKSIRRKIIDKNGYEYIKEEKIIGNSKSVWLIKDGKTYGKTVDILYQEAFIPESLEIVDLDGEIWKPIKGYETKYEISNKGRVKSLNYLRTNKPQIMSPKDNGKGYQEIILCKDGTYIHHYIHRLVGEAFIPNPNNLPEINHINEIKNDNRVENLEWCDHLYNNRYNDRGKKIGDKLRGRNNNHSSKPVIQYDMDGNFIKEWPSLNEVVRNGITNHSSLRAALKGHRGNKKIYSAGGYKWRYKEDY